VFHNNDIGALGLTGHDSSDGTDCFDRLKRYIPNAMGMAENISFGDSKTDKGKRVVL